MEWYLMVWKRYAQFSGRSRRKELWMFVLFNTIIGTALYLCGMATMGQSSSLSMLFFGLYFVYLLAALVPGWAVGARRLHDTGRSGWWWLIALVPFVGAILLIVWWATDGQPGDNQYGPNPKLPAPAAAIG
jgi:uncharacterized membrane protein YhaH (DUF805 family)